MAKTLAEYYYSIDDKHSFKNEFTQYLSNNNINQQIFKKTIIDRAIIQAEHEILENLLEFDDINDMTKQLAMITLFNTLNKYKYSTDLVNFTVTGCLLFKRFGNCEYDNTVQSRIINIENIWNNNFNIYHNIENHKIDCYLTVDKITLKIPVIGLSQFLYILFCMSEIHEIYFGYIGQFTMNTIVQLFEKKYILQDNSTENQIIAHQIILYFPSLIDALIINNKNINTVSNFSNLIFKSHYYFSIEDKKIIQLLSQLVFSKEEKKKCIQLMLSQLNIGNKKKLNKVINLGFAMFECFGNINYDGNQFIQFPPNFLNSKYSKKKDFIVSKLSGFMQVVSFLNKNQVINELSSKLINLIISLYTKKMILQNKTFENSQILHILVYYFPHETREMISKKIELFDKFIWLKDYGNLTYKLKSISLLFDLGFDLDSITIDRNFYKRKNIFSVIIKYLYSDALIFNYIKPINDLKIMTNDINYTRKSTTAKFLKLTMMSLSQFAVEHKTILQNRKKWNDLIVTSPLFNFPNFSFLTKQYFLYKHGIEIIIQDTCDNFITLNFKLVLQLVKILRIMENKTQGYNSVGNFQYLPIDIIKLIIKLLCCKSTDPKRLFNNIYSIE